MVDHQILYGKKFYLDQKTGYWISTQSPKIRAHQWVWKHHHSLIPNGYHIHHRNENKSDNRIENLELIEASRHLSIHSSKPENKERVRKLVDKIRPLTKAWHASEEGIKWHKQHAKEMGFGQNPMVDYVCDQCAKPYQSNVPSKNHSRFCSNNCKSAWRRAQKKDVVIKQCFHCGKDFESHKYNKTLCCGRMCAAQMRKK
jgi:hypothetical protein